MSGLLAVVRTDGAPTADAVVQRMLRAMSRRGDDRAEVFNDGGVTLAVQRAEWEFGADFSGPMTVVQDGDIVVVADARLYYRDDLRRKLASQGVRAKGQTASQLIAATYQAYGDGCAEALEGDFSYVLWDRRKRRLHASRDYSGVRPLFWSTVPGGLVIASTVGAVAAHPDVSHDLDMATLAIDAAGLVFSGGDGTALHAVRQCPAGATLTHMGASTPRLTRWFSLGAAEGTRERPRDEAAEGLRAVLGQAIDERLALTGPSTVWTSGGFDSPAVLALGLRAAQQREARLVPVSASFPEGDSAREDETVRVIAAHLNTNVHWMDGGAMPLIDVDHDVYTPLEDEPPLHLHGPMLQLLSQGSRECASHVGVHGHAGDFLFNCGPSYLSDLLARGRLMELRREWQALGVRSGGFRAFSKYAVEPLIPPFGRRLIETTRGRPLMGVNERQTPSWMQTPTVRQLDIPERAREAAVLADGEGRAAAEFRWYFTNPGLTRLAGVMAELCLAEGVESRSPMHDLRVVRFVARGTRRERYAGGEGKHLLRDAMRPLLPAEVLARRAFQTGTLTTRLDESIRQAVPVLKRLHENSQLAERGLLDPEAFRESVARLENRKMGLVEAEQLLRTAIVEGWLRRRHRSAPDSHVILSAPSRMAVHAGAAMSAAIASGDSRLFQPRES